MKKLQKGKDLFDKRLYNEAIEVLNSFLKETPNNADALYIRAICYRKTGNFEESIADFTTILKRLPEEASLYCERGISYFHHKNIELSLKDLDKAVLLEPNNPYRYTSRAYIKANINVNDAIKDYKKAIELDPEDEIAYNNLGLLEENIGKMTSAKEHFKKADEIVGYHPEKIENIDTQKQDSIGKIMLSIFTSKKTRNEYFNFIKSLFKNKAPNE